MTRPKKLVVLGGTGHFGRRICRRLAVEPDIELIVTSRHAARSAAMIDEIMPARARIHAIALDQGAADLETQLAHIAPDIVVHTAGPYQMQDYRVAETCLSIGSHYIDLADGRDFVTGLGVLDRDARDADVLLVSGASTLPGLSSAVIDHLSDRFERIESITISIAPAHRSPRGPGTIAAVLSYCGRPFPVLVDGRWSTRYGWQHLRLQHYPALGRRLSAMCDVPDLSLLPAYVNDVRTVTFHAALEAPWEQLSLWLMAWLARARFVGDWTRATPALNRIGRFLTGLGSQTGGMHVRIAGTGCDGNALALAWHLTAGHGHGPEIPCIPAVILARKLARGEIDNRGAQACLGMITLDEFATEVDNLDITWDVLVETAR